VSLGLNFDSQILMNQDLTLTVRSNLRPRSILPIAIPAPHHHRSNLNLWFWYYLPLNEHHGCVGWEPPRLNRGGAWPWVRTMRDLGAAPPNPTCATLIGEEGEPSRGIHTGGGDGERIHHGEWWPVAGFDDDEEPLTPRRRSSLAEDMRTRGDMAGVLLFFV
jgi:hypothetical protein